MFNETNLKTKPMNNNLLQIRVHVEDLEKIKIL
jgi:hypothetical protein